MNFFRKAACFNAVPLVPSMDLATDKITSHDLFTAIHDLWNKDEISLVAYKDKRIRALVLEAIFDKRFQVDSDTIYGIMMAED